VKLLVLPLPGRSLLLELTLDVAEDLVELGAAWASLGTISPSPGSERTGNNTSLSRLGRFVGDAVAKTSFDFYWRHAGGILLKSCKMFAL
jgi:hypothetical protein